MADGAQSLFLAIEFISKWSHNSVPPINIWHNPVSCVNEKNKKINLMKL